MIFLLATWNEPLSTVVQPHLYMLRRCVGFSWAQPLCCEKSNASPCVHSVETSHAVLRVALFCVLACFPALRARAHLFWFPPHMQSFFMFFVVFMVKMPRQIEKGLYSKRKRLILKLKKTCFAFEKGFYCRRIWYHITKENGTILKENMVPYSQRKWYHIQTVNGTIFFSNMSLIENQLY